MEPKPTVAEKLEAKTEPKAESKTELAARAEPKAEAKVEAKAEKSEPKVEARLDIKEPAKAEVKVEAKETKTEGKSSKRKIRKDVSFTETTPTTSPIPEPVHTTPTMTHAKPIGPPPGFKIDAAKQGIAKMNSGGDGGSSSSSETENMGITRHGDRSSLTSSSETSAWNYGLKRSGDIAPPPGWNPPASAVDPWTKLTQPQTAKSTDLPDMEQFDPWADNAALGIVDLLLKDNAEEGATSKAAHQANPALAHLQTPPTFAVPSIPPPDFHWQTPIAAPGRTQRSRFDFAREEDDPSSTAATTSNGAINTTSTFPLLDPGIVAAKPASKTMGMQSFLSV